MKLFRHAFKIERNIDGHMDHVDVSGKVTRFYKSFAITAKITFFFQIVPNGRLYVILCRQEKYNFALVTNHFSSEAESLKFGDTLKRIRSIDNFQARKHKEIFKWK